jgi:quercetin dioxygenase-like cupin family protein
MSGKRAVALTVILTVGVFAGGLLPLAAQEAPLPIAVELLTDRAVFTDDIDLKVKTNDGRSEVVKVEDPSRMVVARITVQPGAQFPWHTHPGPVFVNVVEGTLIFVETDCSERAYPAGTAFVDLGHGHVHSAYSPIGGQPTVIVATFLEISADGPLLIPADTPACVS